MCAIDMECSDAFTLARPMARKPHRCKSCGGTVAVGSVYVRLTVVNDGSADTEKSCLACWADNETFSQAHGFLWITPSAWPDELAQCVETRWTLDDVEERYGEWAPMLARFEARAATVAP